MNVSGNSDPDQFTVVGGNRLYFAANDGSNGRELWESDGTTAGTILREVQPGPASSNPAGLSAIGNSLYFASYDSVTGYELYRSTSPAELVVDLNVTSSSLPQVVGASSGNVIFTAEDDGGVRRLFAGSGPGFVAALAEAGLVLTPVQGVTVTEGGSAVTYTGRLASQPSANVTVRLDTDITQVSLSTDEWTFTPVNWDQEQSVTVTAIDDMVDEVLLNIAIEHEILSSDVIYQFLGSQKLPLVIHDDDVAGITLTPPTLLETSETGSTASFNVVLNSQPTADVSFLMAVTDPTEASLSEYWVKFTPHNWNIAQTVTIHGVDDLIRDGDITYKVVTSDSSSRDAFYNGLAIDDLTLINRDNEVNNPPTANLASPASGSSVVVGLVNGQRYIDVAFSDTGGSGLNTATINGDEFTLSGSGVGTASLAGTATLVSGTTYRYAFTGDFAVGAVDVNFISGRWQDNAGNANLAKTESFVVQANPVSSLVRTVRVRLTDKDYLQLNEVRVIQQGTGTNLALAGTATQSSTYNASISGPGKAIDGDTTSGYPTSVALTKLESGAWWQVDLGDGFDVSRIVVHNRNTEGTRLQDAVVEALDAAGNVLWSDTITGAVNNSVHSFNVVTAPLADTTPPTADLASPSNNSSIAVSSLNGQDYIDVTYSDTGGSGLKTATINGDEFTLGGSGVGTASLAGTAILVSGSTYRYAFTGDFAVGDVDVNFIAGRWQDNAGNNNLAETESFRVLSNPPADTTPPTAGLASPASGSSVMVGSINGQRYVDVTFADVGGSGLSVATINGDEFTLSGSGVGTASLAGTATLVSGTTYRYAFTGDFAVGAVDVNFISGRWQDNAGNANLAKTESFVVQANSVSSLVRTVRIRLTDKDYLQLNEVQVIQRGTGTNLALAGTATQSSIYNASTSGPGKAIDGDTTSGYPTSVALTKSEFGAWWQVDLGGGFDVSRIVVHNRNTEGTRLQDAVVEALDAAGNVLWSDTITGAVNNSVHSFNVAIAPPANTTPLTANLASHSNSSSIAVGLLNSQDYIDVTYSDTGGSGLKTATINGDEFTLSGSGVGTASLAGTATLVSGSTYRYAFTGDFEVGDVDVNFIAGRWQDNAGNNNLAKTESFRVLPNPPADTTPPTAGLASPASGSSVMVGSLNGQRNVDVTFADVGGSGLSVATINGDEFTLSGSGVGTASLAGTATLVSGTTYRYAFTGDFAVGDVDVNFISGRWQDNAGNANLAKTESFVVQANSVSSLVRTVRVRLTDKDYLQLNEVQVIQQGTGTNLALAGTAMQSSIYSASTSGPGKAIDGDTTSGYPTSVALTKSESGAWWQVDLGGGFDVSRIVVHNRNTEGTRLQDAVVEALDAAGNVLWSDTITGAVNNSVHSFNV